MRTLRATLALGVLALTIPAVAAADTRISISRGELSIFSDDVGVANQLLIEPRGSDIRIFEPVDPFGMSYPPQCLPGRTNSQGNTIEVFCPSGGITSIAADIGPAEDKVDGKYPLPTAVGGGSGADTLTTLATDDNLVGDQGNDTLDAGGGKDDLRGGDGNDTLRGGDGNDTLFGEGGADSIDGGAGDDNINTPDGVADKVVCGAGNDTVVADTLDEVAADCENVPPRQFVSPTEGGQTTADDKTKPKVAIGGSTKQRVSSRRRTLRIAATSNEKGEIECSGFLEFGASRLAMKVKARKVNVAGGGVELAIVLTKGQLKQVLKALARRRKVRAKMKVIATDAAGNASKPAPFTITLRR